MLQARRQTDHQIVTAYLESKSNGPFACLECGDEVILKAGRLNVNHFAHVNPLACQFGRGESDEHRRCKIEIFEALQREPGVQSIVMERALGSVRPDISCYIKGVPVAIEVQISSLSIETIMARTIEYHRKRIYVLWLLLWTPDLEQDRYSPKNWEKWIHAAYFGNVYYWLRGISIAQYRFEPVFTRVPSTTWYSKMGRKVRGGGYNKRLNRFRKPTRVEILNLAHDFNPQQRYWWEGDGIKVPDAKLFMHKDHRHN